MKPKTTHHADGMEHVVLDVAHMTSSLSFVCFRVGGIVESLIWDSRGQYLSVLFKKTDLIAIFSTELHVVLQVAPW